MEVTQVLHMNGGDGETSYAKNSSIQNRIITRARPILEEAMTEMLSNIKPAPTIIRVADLGCSSGPNSLLAVSEIIDFIEAKCTDLGLQAPGLSIFLNDLPFNDFNCLFRLLPEFYSQLRKEKGTNFGPCFVSATPGSFYGRLFPSMSMHCVHSSSSLHWLSQVPPALDSKAEEPLNKGKIYISRTSPQCVSDAYSRQFQKDFSLFLKSSSEEIVPNGRMVLQFLGRRSPNPITDDSCYHFELLAEALMTLVLEDRIEEKKVDSFNVPFYGPCAEELKLEIQKEGSFIIDRLETFELDWDGGAGKDACVAFATQTGGQTVSKAVRAVVESMLESQFGRDIIDELFLRYAEIVNDYFSKSTPKFYNFFISMVRKNQRIAN